MAKLKYGGLGYKVLRQFQKDKMVNYPVTDYYTELINSGAVMAILPQKADGYNQGVNAPLTDPIKDITKVGNDADLVGFAGTTSDGYAKMPVLASNGQDVAYSNLVTNGDFVNGTTGWNNTGFTGFSVVGGVARATATAQFSSIGSNNIELISGKRYYCKGKLKSDSTSVNLRVQKITTPFTNQVISNSDGLNTLKEYSNLITASFSATDVQFRVFDSRSSGWTQVEFDDFQVINISDNPYIISLESVLGRKLTALDCDRIFPFTATTNTVKVGVPTFLQSDGVDSLGTIALNQTNIGANEDFALTWCGLLPSTLDTGFAFSNNLLDATTEVLASIINSNGSIGTYVANSLIATSSAGSLLPNALYDFRLIRKSGTLTLDMYDSLGTKTQIFSVANTSVLTWQPNTRLFCRSSNAGGTTRAAFLKVGLAWCTLHRGTGVANVDKAINSIAKNFRMVV